MERTIYSKYSNERAERFRIRTDIVTDEAGEKKVYKYACTIQAGDHIRRQEELGKQLDAAYAGSRITFCPCTTEDVPGGCRSVSPFVQGDNLQHLMEQAVAAGDWETVEQMIAAYADRVSGSGGEIPFDRTPEFAEVFGEGKFPEGIPCATVSDVDMIFSNIFVESGKAAADSAWTVIDYEWTFPFPVPKKYLIYRAVYYAYYQIFKAEGKSLADWLKSAGLTEEETECFARMEVHFQEYLRAGAFPVRSMQRRMGTRIIPFAALLEGAGAGDGSEIVRESAYLRVRKLLYHIDRAECQDGSRVCSGWAFAKTWDGRCLPVNIRVAAPGGEQFAAEITRRARADVAEMFKLRRVENPEFGFDCVWQAAPEQRFCIYFSLGNRESIYEG